MKIVVLSFLLINSFVFGQKTEEVFSSNKLGSDRSITIELPKSYDSKTSKKYPVLYLLDAEYLFDPFSGAINYGAYWDDLPETIIVGIHQNKNGERFEDCNVDDATGLPYEKANNFFEFVGGELVPYIEKKYRTTSFKIIAGHDVTATFINFYLYKDKPLFNAYICLSPELAPKMEIRLPEKFAKSKEQIFYYLSVADGDVKSIREPVDHLNNNIKLANRPNINFKFDVFPHTTHYTEVLFSIPSALYHIFELYRPINSVEYKEKIATLSSGFADYLDDKYNAMSKAYGLNIPVRMTDYAVIEKLILKNKAYEELGKMAEIGNVHYPKAMLGEYQLGRMYELLGDPKRASKKYQNASQMEPIGDLNKDVMYEKIDEMNMLAKKN